MARTKSKQAKQRRGPQAETDETSNRDRESGNREHSNGKVATQSQSAGGIAGFLTKIDELTEGEASEAISQVRETYESATTTIAQAIETIDLAKRTFVMVRAAAQDVFAKAKQKPEPFIQAAVPAAVGVFMFLRQLQGGSMRPSGRTRGASRTSVMQ